MPKCYLYNYLFLSDFLRSDAVFCHFGRFHGETSLPDYGRDDERYQRRDRGAHERVRSEMYRKVPSIRPP